MGNMQSEREPWQRVAAAVLARRAARGWTQVDVATNGSLSLDRVQAIEGAKRASYRAGTIAALERGLEWEYGSISAILAGGEPIPKEQQAPPDPGPAESDDGGYDSPIERGLVDALLDEIERDPRKQARLRRILAERGHEPNPNSSNGDNSAGREVS